MGLARTSPITRSKFSLPVLLQGGVHGNLIVFNCAEICLTITSCTAPSGNLDYLSAILRTREHVELLFRLLDPDDLWTRYGVISDVKVRQDI